jgi:phosphoglycerate dehydrogenase-like enzyme
MDVFVPEPLPADSELRDIPNLLVTAHIAGGTQYEGEYIIEILRENLGKYLCGDFPLRNQVDKNLGF